jgi:hypothetical protein
MKTLDQIEPRTPLAQGVTVDHNITVPGHYYLTGSVRSIQINATNVTLDLNGFSVVQTTNGSGIDVQGESSNAAIIIHNGRIIGPGAVSYSGNPWPSGYAGNSGSGIAATAGNVSSDNLSRNIRVEDVTIKGFGTGINTGGGYEYAGGRTVISRCTVLECFIAINTRFANFSDCTVSACSVNGIETSFSTLDKVVIDRCGGGGIVGSQNDISGCNMRFCGGNGISSSDSTLSHITVSGCADGVVVNNSSLDEVTVYSNRGNGLNGSGNSVVNSVFRSNGGNGVQGSFNTMKNISANNNIGHGIAGDSFAVDGGIANGNGGTGIIGGGSTVRGVRASSNAGAGVWCDDSVINECMIYSNAADGIRGVNSTINTCRSLNNDTNTSDGYTASDIYWFGGRQQGNVAGTYSPAAPAP